jgi:hypothetical protein
LSVKAFDLAALSPPLFAGEDANEAAKSGSSGHHLGGATGVGPRLTRASGIWIRRLYRGRVLVTMGGARSPLRSVRSA